LLAAAKVDRKKQRLVGKKKVASKLARQIDFGAVAQHCEEDDRKPAAGEKQK
jgi:hypothetical protein